MAPRMARPADCFPSTEKAITLAMQSPLFQALRALRERIQDVPQRVKVAVAVGNKSGLMWEITRPGLVAMVRALTGGAQNPSQVYRLYAANSPDKIALRWRDQALTFKDLDEKIDRFATGLASRGVGRGSSVIVMTKNRPEFLIAQCGASRIGAAAVSVSWRSTAAELEYLATHSGAKMICFEHDLWPTVAEAKKRLPNIPPESFVAIGGDVPGCTPPCTSFEDLLKGEPYQDDGSHPEEDAAVVIYTSGTTGKPKGAVRKFPKDALAAALRFIAETPMRTDDVHLVTCPLYHSTAFGFLALSHMLGATVVIMDEFKPELFLRDVERWGVTTTAVVPTMLHRVVSLPPETLAKYSARTLRVIFSGGAPLSGPLALEVMDRFGDVLFNFYGATETGLVTLAKPQDLRASPGTIGKVVPGNEIRLLDDAGHEVPQGTVGELYVLNKMLVAGYHKDEAATKESMRDGFFSVGDLARRDRDGRYFIEGRTRDMVISGGVNVYPAEVEAVLEAHPDIAEVAVVGVEDPEWGERVRAFIVKRAGATIDEGELRSFVRERLAGAKVPRDFVFLDTLPRNPTGKVLKRELRAHVEQARAGEK
jgi:fatty-acyl-CoA synthase